ncbi:hypothetical protein QVZ43_03645 [Marinobacter sp. chi1]|uniref:Pilus assembly protein CpaE n=1 Tax=Marinobacter suaedae TaxID=3057675 RepID=A0ABT8VXT1_9GAMM|nr:hypothetical protein [Marinobacter sp. chi1]MDO3720802.1 hypothetical protein [Marinobacter sp. chi1]
MNDLIVQPLQSKAENQIKPRVPLAVPVSVLVIAIQPEAARETARELESIPNLTVTHAGFKHLNPAQLQDHQTVLLHMPDDSAHALHLVQELAPQVKNCIVIGNNVTPELTRSALRAGVIDFVSGKPEDLDDLIQALYSIADHLVTEVKLAPLQVVINAKGGSGASFLSMSLADQLSLMTGGKAALADGDHLNASQSAMLKGAPEYHFQDALREASSLDDSAIKGLMSQFSGIALLPAAPFGMLRPNHFDFSQLPTLLFKLRTSFESVVFDLSRGAEHWSVPVLQQADNIFIVVQDNVVCLRDAANLIRYAVRELDIPKERMQVVVNRYLKNPNSLKLEEIEKALGTDQIVTVRNDYKLASLAMEQGKTLSVIAPNKRITKQIKEIAQQAQFGKDQQPQKSIWRRWFG